MTDPITITITVKATPDEDSGPFTATDLFDAVSATLHEVFPNDATGWPVVPEVTLAQPDPA